MTATPFRLYKTHELGPDGYPPAWHERVKHEARVLAGDRCVRCLHPYESGMGEWSPCDTRCRHYGRGNERRFIMADGTIRDDAGVDERYRLKAPPFLVELRGEIDQIEARWRILTVHHLNLNKADCRWWNLCALCQKCHLSVQGRVKMNQVWPWEHSHWFRVYAAGYYALVYLGEELTRPEVEARLDELLALERASA